MDTFFSISQGYTTNFRPPISYKVREYFEQFVTEKILQAKNLLIGGKWRIKLALYFVGEGRLGLPKTVQMYKNPITISAEKTKLYEILIPVKLIQQSDDPYHTTIELMFAAIKTYFTTTYKRVTPAVMDQLWEQIDFNYLSTLPYPADMKDQKYAGDIVLPDGTIRNVVPRPE